MTEFVRTVYEKAAEYFNGDVRRIQHYTKVLQFATLIAEGEALSPAEEEILQTAAILHDIGIPESEKKYGSAIGKYQQIEGVPVAQAILTSLDAPEKMTAAVCGMISLHHTYSKIGENRLLRILVEADMLVNAFEEDVPKEGVAAFKENVVRTQTGRKLFRILYHVLILQTVTDAQRRRFFVCPVHFFVLRRTGPPEAGDALAAENLDRLPCPMQLHFIPHRAILYMTPAVYGTQTLRNPQRCYGSVCRLG